MFRLPCLLCVVFCFVMIRRPPRSTRTDTLFPYTRLFRSLGSACCSGIGRMRRSSCTFPAKHVAACDPCEGGIDAFAAVDMQDKGRLRRKRSEEHTSELQSLMRISYAVFCLTKTIMINGTLPF